MSRKSRSPGPRTGAAHTSRPGHPADALDQVEASIEAAWARSRDAGGGLSDESAARRIVADPHLHPWRLVDAALDRLRCPDCGDALGRGPRGCGPCDLADGFRFAAREPDLPGVPAGNEHAVRVSTAVLRSPRRHPAWAVAANRAHLPLFLAGLMPTRAEQEAVVAAARAGVLVDDAGDETFAALAVRASDALANRS